MNKMMMYVVITNVKKTSKKNSNSNGKTQIVLLPNQRYPTTTILQSNQTGS